MRDDISFREAMDCLDSQLQTIERQLENSIGDTAELERDKIRLESNKMHLLLQQGWESGRRALDLAEKLAQKTGEMPFRLQRVQLHTMLGKNRQIRLECEKISGNLPVRTHSCSTLKRCAIWAMTRSC